MTSFSIQKHKNISFNSKKKKRTEITYEFSIFDEDRRKMEYFPIFLEELKDLHTFLGEFLEQEGGGNEA